MQQDKTHFDIVVVGGGMVGAAAACLLAQQGWQIAVIEQTEPEAYSPEQAMDLRVSAISPVWSDCCSRLAFGTLCWRCESELILNWQPGKFRVWKLIFMRRKPVCLSWALLWKTV